jgi:CP family cyanate transporter-like MFS transporter
MSSAPIHDGSRATSRARFLTSLLLLWLGGVALRLTILAVPPVIPLIHDELNLNATQIGIPTGLPSMLFAIAAVPGSLLIAKLGVRAALVVGLAIAAIGGALRGAMPDIVWLYAMTVAMGAGVAIMQVTMPPAVRAWTPHAVVVPVISGMMWDMSGRPELAFLPIALCGIILAVLAPAINHVWQAET